jgi:hypothetical protein
LLSLVLRLRKTIDLNDLEMAASGKVRHRDVRVISKARRETVASLAKDVQGNRRRAMAKADLAMDLLVDPVMDLPADQDPMAITCAVRPATIGKT